MNDINRCFMSKTLNAFSQNSKTRSYSVLPRSPSIATRANAHTHTVPLSQKYAYIESAIHGHTCAFCCFCNLLPRVRFHLNMFEFLQFYIKQTRVFLNSIYQILPCCTRRHCRKQTYEWQNVIGRQILALRALRCVRHLKIGIKSCDLH